MTSRKIAMNFLKEIKVIFFVESSKKGCGTKIGHLSGLKSSDTWLGWLMMHFDRLHVKVGWYSATRYTQIPIFRILPFKQANHRLSTVDRGLQVHTGESEEEISMFLVYLVEERCPPRVQDYRLMLWFLQDFRALLLGFNKKPETVFLSLVLERHFLLSNLLFSENLAFYRVGKKTLEKVHLIKNFKKNEISGTFCGSPWPWKSIHISFTGLTYIANNWAAHF